MKSVRTILGISICLVATMSSALHANAQRPLQIDDLFRSYRIPVAGGSFYERFADSTSPDGKLTTYVLERPIDMQKGPADANTTSRDVNRADVWIIDNDRKAARSITDGSNDGTGFWAPFWSPDGSKLAMFSTRGGNVTLWVWDRATGRLHQLLSRGYDYWDQGYTFPTWTSNRTIVGTFLPPGVKSQDFYPAIEDETRANALWNASKNGRAGVSIVDTGTDQPPSDAQNTLLSVDVETNRSVILAHGEIKDIRISPNHAFAAFIVQTKVYRPHGDEPLKTDYSGYSVAVVDLHGNHVLAPIQSIKNVSPEYSHEWSSVVWSPDSTHLAIRGQAPNGNGSYRLFTVSIPDGKITDVLGNVPLEPQNVMWLPSGLLLFSTKASELPRGLGNSGWWSVHYPQRPVSVTNGAGLQRSFESDQFFYSRNGRSIYGISGGALWKFDGHGGQQRIARPVNGTIDSIVWPSTSYQVDTTLVVSISQGLHSSLSAIDVRSGAMSVLHAPRPDALLYEFEPKSKLAAFTLSDRSGLYLWLTPFNGPSHVLVRENEFLQNIVQTPSRHIFFTSTDGQKLDAWLLMPINYKPGHRYPMLVWIYPGQTAGPAFPFSISDDGETNLNLLASHGYAVLYPTVPVRPMPYIFSTDNVGDPMLDLIKSVVPAADKVVAMGIADSSRLAVAGQSGGGWATYGVITQTHRFAAALSMAGYSDLLSAYGTFGAERHSDDPFADMDFGLFEQYFFRFGVPPWSDLERYLRNSPIRDVQNVTTPIMIVQGDVDFVPMEQGEEFTTAMHRLGKRARFVRYWGEGHVIENEANIRDLWERIYGWFDHYLCSGSVSKTRCVLPPS